MPNCNSAGLAQGLKLKPQHLLFLHGTFTCQKHDMLLLSERKTSDNTNA